MTINADDIRLAPGTVTAYNLLTTSSYLVTNWTRPSDIAASQEWSAIQYEKGALQRFAPSLGVGTGKRLGKYRTILQFFQLTPLMIRYIETTILAGNGIGAITCYIHTPTDSEVFAVFTGEMVSPFHADSDLTYIRLADELYGNVQYELRRLTVATLNVLSPDGVTNVLVDASGNVIAT